MKVPKAEMPKYNVVKNPKAQVVGKGGAPQATAESTYQDIYGKPNQQQPNANTAAPVQQMQGGGEAPTGLKTAPLTQFVQEQYRAAIMYNRKVYQLEQDKGRQLQELEYV